MAGTTYDRDTTANVTGVLLSIVTVNAIKDASTPGGELPTVNLTTIGVASTFDINSFNGAVINLSETVGLASTYNLTANGGTINASSTVAVGTQNVITDENGGTFTAGGTFLGALTAGSGIKFVGTGNTLNITSSGSALNLLSGNAIISGFVKTDVINESGISFSAANTYTIAKSGSNQTVEFFDIHGNDLGALEFAGGTFVSNGTFNAIGGPLLLSSAGGALSITLCFLGGTQISTPTGERAVESLKAGDPILTADGRVLPLRWLGVRTVCAAFADGLLILPIRIRAGALSDNVPLRDLLVSPDHAVFINDTLIQASALVNGRSIIRETGMPRTFRYYHVELEDHSLILANGAVTETFVDNVSRMAFDNWSEHQACFGDGASIPEMEYPRVKSARQIPRAIRELLAARLSCFAEELCDVA